MVLAAQQEPTLQREPTFWQSVVHGVERAFSVTDDSIRSPNSASEAVSFGPAAPSPLCDSVLSINAINLPEGLQSEKKVLQEFNANRVSQPCSKLVKPSLQEALGSASEVVHSVGKFKANDASPSSSEALQQEDQQRMRLELLEVYSVSADFWFPALVLEADKGAQDVTVLFWVTADEPKRKTLPRADEHLAPFGTHTKGSVPPGFVWAPSPLSLAPDAYIFVDASTQLIYETLALAWEAHFQKLLAVPSDVQNPGGCVAGDTAAAVQTEAQQVPKQTEEQEKFEKAQQAQEWLSARRKRPEPLESKPVTTECIMPVVNHHVPGAALVANSAIDSSQTLGQTRVIGVRSSGPQELASANSDTHKDIQAEADGLITEYVVHTDVQAKADGLLTEHEITNMQATADGLVTEHDVPAGMISEYKLPCGAVRPASSPKPQDRTEREAIAISMVAELDCAPFKRLDIAALSADPSITTTVP